MPLDWLNTPVDVPISELIARKKRARTIELLRAQLQGRLAPGVQVRLQLADLLVQAGRGEEAIPVLIGLADEFAADGFVAKAIAILKRVEKVHGSNPDVASRLAALVQQQQRAARTASKEGAPRRPVEIGIEEFGPDDALKAAEAFDTDTGPLPTELLGAPTAMANAVAATVDASEGPASEAAAVAPEAVAPEAATAGDAAEGTGVAQRIRGVFRRFLASLPTPPEDIASGDAVPATPPVEVAPPGVGDAPAVASDATPAGIEAEEPTVLEVDEPAPPIEVPPELAPEDEALAPEAEPAALEITLEPEAETEPALAAPPAELSQQAFEAHLLDIVEEVLQQPPPLPARGIERPRVVEYAHRLLATPLLSALSEEELLAVVRGLEVRTFEAGDVVVTEREPGQSLYLVTGGRVKVFVRNPAGRNFAVAQIGAGDFFGEISSLSGRPRTATVVAAAPTDILELDKATLERIARAHPRVKDVLEAAYIARASSPEAAAIRAVPVSDPFSDQRAIEILEAHFGESRWDPRMRLRLADVLLRAGKDEDAVPILVGLADELARQGYPEKAIAILKKIERLQHRHIEEVSLAPSLKQGGAAPHPPAPPPPAATRKRLRTDDKLHAWLLDTVRHTVRQGQRGVETGARAVRGYGPGLRASPLFEGFTEDELLAVIQALRLLSFGPGDVIVTEGEPGQSVFILAGGTVKVFVRTPVGHDVPVSVLGEGSFFGEMSTLSGQPRSATVTAASPCDLLELDRATLDRLAERHPNVRAVLEEFSRRRAADPAAAAARRRATP